MIRSFKAGARGLINAIKKAPQFYGFAALAVTVAALYAFILHDRTLPFAEGWYTYFAKCIQNGLLPYRDFEYLYPPVYIYTVALITRIFGYDILVLRRIGILFFALITLGVYLSAVTVVGKRRSYIALIATGAAVFYLQSEVVQTFYDYVRLMDVFSAFSLFLLLKAVKSMINKEPYRKSLVGCGVLLGVFINIKQNIGLIFFVYALILVLYTGLWCRHDRRALLRDAARMLLPVLAITALILAALAASGSLSAYLSMTTGAAAGAKGGISAILFGWLFNNRTAFLHAAPVALILLAITVGPYLLGRFVAPPPSEPSGVQQSKAAQVSTLLALVFSLLCLVGFFLLMLSRGFAVWLMPTHFLSTYAIFLAVTPIFAVLGIRGILDIVRGRQSLGDLFLLFALSGAYFAISFGCGNSGGLAEGQATFGVLFLAIALLLLCEYFYNACRDSGAWRLGTHIAKGTVTALCLVLTLQSAAKKMVYPYNWWGMDEADYWQAREESALVLLRGLYLSPETRTVYEDICRIIEESTPVGAPIFCFPQIPVFYNLTDRPDPGTFTKVQWFDVASDAAVRADIERLRQSPPAAILIYNTSEYAYLAHENAFRGGNRSATREMRDFLYRLAAEQGYRHCGDFRANGNSLTLFVLPQ